MKNPSLPANEIPMAQGAADALARAGFSRRTFIKGTGALIVSFSMGGALRNARSAANPRGRVWTGRGGGFSAGQ